MLSLSGLAVRAVRLYQLCLSPWVGRECRYLPTCSAYSIESFEKHGFLKGLYLTVMRLLRCHPLGGREYDPVPEKFRWRCWCDACESDDEKRDRPGLFTSQTK